MEEEGEGGDRRGEGRRREEKRRREEMRGMEREKGREERGMESGERSGSQV